MKIILSTQNVHKVKEFGLLFPNYEILLPSDFIKNMPDVIEDGDTYQENAEKKCFALATELLKTYDQIPFPIISDDSGLEIRHLNKMPGIHSRRYWTKDGTEGSHEFNNKEMIATLLMFPKPWKAKYVAAVSVMLPIENTNKQQMHTKIGNCFGEIIETPRGSNGFAYDEYFKILGLDLTVAELTAEEKAKISHRGLAAKQIKSILDEYFLNQKSNQ